MMDQFTLLAGTMSLTAVASVVLLMRRGSAGSRKADEAARREAEAAAAELMDQQDAADGYPTGAVAENAGRVDGDVKVPAMAGTYVVTGGAGMVGTRLVRMLLERGAKRVISTDVATPSAEAVAEAAASSGRLELSQSDIAAEDAQAQLTELFEGADVVFHVAAVVGPFYPHALFHKVNFIGTQNVIAACRAAGVKALVDCGSPSTRFRGLDACNVEGSNEVELPLVADRRDSVHEYAWTKGLGERAVLEANGSELRTCVVQPHQVYAPEDRLFLPAMLETAKSGKLRVFAKGANMVSFTHAGNLSHALALAAHTLTGGDGAARADEASGETYLVTDGGVHNFWDAIDAAVVQCGMPSLRDKAPLPVWLLLLVARVGAIYTAVTGNFFKLTRFTVRMTTVHRYFRIGKIRRILEYKPIYYFQRDWPTAVDAIGRRMDIIVSGDDDNDDSKKTR